MQKVSQPEFPRIYLDRLYGQPYILLSFLVANFDLLISFEDNLLSTQVFPVIDHDILIDICS